jgi:hypothetical protein
VYLHQLHLQIEANLKSLIAIWTIIIIVI